MALRINWLGAETSLLCLLMQENLFIPATFGTLQNPVQVQLNKGKSHHLKLNLCLFFLFDSLFIF